MSRSKILPPVRARHLRMYGSIFAGLCVGSSLFLSLMAFGLAYAGASPLVALIVMLAATPWLMTPAIVFLMRMVRASKHDDGKPGVPVSLWAIYSRLVIKVAVFTFLCPLFVLIVVPINAWSEADRRNPWMDRIAGRRFVTFSFNTQLLR